MTDYLESSEAPTEAGQEPSGWNIGVKYGLIAGLLAIALQLVGYLSGMSDMEKQMSGEGMLWGGVSWLGTMAITIIMAVMAIKAYRSQSPNGVVSFGKAFTISFAVALLKAVLVAIFAFVFLSFIIPDQLDEVREMIEESMAESGAEDSGMASFFTGMATSPAFSAVSSFITTVIGGSILGLIVSLIMKND